MKILLVLGSFFLLIANSFFTYMPSSRKVSTLKDSVFAEYRYIAPAKDGVISIILKKNKNYEYSFANHLQQFSSSGKWEIKKDTLILSSCIQKTNLPITVIEESDISSSEYLQIDWIKNQNEDILKDAEMLFNEDTSKSCMPVFENDCKIKKEALRSIQIRLSNNIASKWYKIKSKNVDKLKITVDIPFLLDTYLIFNKEKFIIVGKKLYETEQKIIKAKGQLKSKLSKNTKYYFTKIK